MDPDEETIVVNVVGPWVIGGFVEAIMQGIIFSQINHYFTWYTGDTLQSRIMVGILCLITTLRSVHVFSILWYSTVLNYGNLFGVEQLLAFTWWGVANPVIVAVIGAYVQLFYCRRLYVISRHSWIVYPIAAILTFAIAAVIVVQVTIDKPELNLLWFNLYLGSTFVGDTLIALATGYALYKLRLHSGPRSRNTINTLLRLCFQCAIPIAFCMLTQLIISVNTPLTVGSRGIAVNVGLSVITPKVYGICMMYTLNTRKTVLMVGPSSDRVGATTHTNSNTPPTTPAPNRTRTSASANIYFDTISRIQMQTFDGDEMAVGGLSYASVIDHDLTAFEKRTSNDSFDHGRYRCTERAQPVRIVRAVDNETKLVGRRGLVTV